MTRIQIIMVFQGICLHSKLNYEQVFMTGLKTVEKYA